MRFVRVFSLALALTLAVSTLNLGGFAARAQTVTETEEEAGTAGSRSEVADGLVDSAVADRAELEIELALTIARMNDLSAEMSIVAVGLDKLQGQIGFADAELATLEVSIEAQAVDAYMIALSFPGISFVSSETVEIALLVGTVVEEVVNSGREQIDRWVAKKRALEALVEDHLAKQQEVSELRAQFDTETESLTSLYEQAHAGVAAAIREANAADTAYRAALSAVESARAREEEKNRQDQRTSATTTTTTSSPTTTAPAPTTIAPTPSSTSPPESTTTTVPPPTTTTTSGGGGSTFPPAVEQWRGLVSEHFPAHRVEEALKIMQCESRGDPDAYNPYSGASGLFQFIPSTWATAAPRAGFPDASPFEPVANTASAAWLAHRYEELGLYYWLAWTCKRVLS